MVVAINGDYSGRKPDAARFPMEVCSKQGCVAAEKACATVGKPGPQTSYFGRLFESIGEPRVAILLAPLGHRARWFPSDG